MNPLAFWTFEDCWKYIAREKIPYHPLHDDGYPSIGDMHSTLRIDKNQWYQVLAAHARTHAPVRARAHAHMKHRHTHAHTHTHTVWHGEGWTIY